MNIQRFKIGQEVVCIENGMWMYVDGQNIKGPAGPAPVIDKIYTVTSYDTPDMDGTQYIVVKELPYGDSWNESAFEALPEITSEQLAEELELTGELI